MCVHACMCACMHVCVCVRACMHVCCCLYVCMHACMHVWLCVCACDWIIMWLVSDWILIHTWITFVLFTVSRREGRDTLFFSYQRCVFLAFIYRVCWCHHSMTYYIWPIWTVPLIVFQLQQQQESTSKYWLRPGGDSICYMAHQYLHRYIYTYGAK